MTATAPDAPAIDLLDPASFADGHPHDQYAWLREHDPVHRHEEPGGRGFWAVTKHEDVRFAGRHPQVFSSSPTIMIPDPDEGFAMFGSKMMLNMDPPLHGAYRRLVIPEFVPKAVAEIRHRVGELATRIIDAVCERGECDLVEDVAGEMPSFVVAELLGLPLDDGRELYKLTETIHAAPESVPEGAGMGAVISMFTYAAEVRAARLANPTDDLASRLAHAEVDGRPFDEIDFNMMFLLLVDAGGDTTRNLLAGGVDALFQHPDQRALLQGDLDRVLPTAMEELLRWVSPVTYMRRTVQQATTLRGVQLAEGDKVALYYGAANRDPDVFEDPDRLDLLRKPNDHLAFGGGGPHFCLGAHLARVEVEALLRELLTRMPDLEPAGRTEWLESVFISGPKHMPVRFSPSAPRGR